MSKNFVFISPTFPKTYYQFPKAWKELGGTSLCIGEDNYAALPKEMKDACSEYYQVGSMKDYDQMYRAVAWFAHKHGKIDWLESNNEFWLEQDARLRTDFNITTGDKTETVMRYKTKSNMKAYYQKAKCPVARFHLTTTLEDGKKFIEEVGYPIIVKPNDGVGASTTYKISDDKELADFYAKKYMMQFIMEEFVPGYIVSFDGLTDQNGRIIFKTSHHFPEPIMNIVNSEGECFYWSERVIPADLNELGTRVIAAFHIKGRFFHTEYFRLTEDKPGLGVKGDLVGLEVNMRPPGGYTPDMMNFANSIDIYKVYANMCMSNTNTFESDRPYHCIYIGKRDKFVYKNNSAAIFTHYGQNIMMHDRMPELLGEAMGNEFYISRFKTEEECMKFASFVYEKADAPKAVEKTETVKK